MKSDAPENLLPEHGFSLSQLAAVESENCIIGGLLLDNSAIDRLPPELVGDHFFDPSNRAIFTEIAAQLAAAKPVDVISLSAVGGGHFDLRRLSELAQYMPGSASLKRHAEIVIDRAKERQLLAVSTLVADLAMEKDRPISERVEQAQAALAKLDVVADADDWVGAYEAGMRHLDLLDQRESGAIKGIPTGLHDLDEMLDGGLQRGNLFVIGARPAMGKSAIAMTIGLHVAIDHVVGMFSMEMPISDVSDRQAAILGHESISMIKRPKKGLAYDRILDGVEQAKRRRFFISEKSGLNIVQLRSKARALRRQHGLDVLIVDYIGLMNGLDSKQPRAYQIEEISRGLKGLAKDLGIVVVCLAQVNRGAAERTSQIPGLHDLRDSGAIEQDADVVAFIHRPIAANPSVGERFANYGLLRVAKNRQGRCGDVHLFYAGEQTRFSSWSGEPPSSSASEFQGRGMN